MTKDAYSLIQRVKGETYYKSRQSYENQKGYFRLHFNQVRENKTSKYKKVCTEAFNFLIEEMKFYSKMEYICAGLNSFERECVVVDCDDTDSGAKSFRLMKEKNLFPHFIKIKPNGHSQFFFFIEKFFIGTAGFNNGEYYEIDYTEQHEKWKWLTKRINLLFNGDAGYTGYNCQNPFFEDGEVIAVKPLDELYTVDSLVNEINGFLSDPVTLDYVNSELRKYYSERKQNSTEKVKREIKKIHFLDEELREVLLQSSQEELKQKLLELHSKKEIIEKIDDVVEELLKLKQDSINKRIFVLVSQICKSFKIRGLLHNKKYFDEIVRTCLQNWFHQDNAVGYTFYQLKKRIQHDIYCIQVKDLNNEMQWDKVNYTDIQREKSLATRRKIMISKRKKVYKIFNDNTEKFNKASLDYVFNFIVSEYKRLYDESISYSTVRNYLIKQYKNILLYIKSHKHNTAKIRYKVFISFLYNNKLKHTQTRTIKNTSRFMLGTLYRYKIKDKDSA